MPRLSSLFILAAVACVTSQSGCTAILGDFSTGAGSDAGADSTVLGPDGSGSSGSDSATPTPDGAVTNDDGSTSNGDGAGSGGDGSMANPDGAAGGSCTRPSTRCSGNGAVQTCGAGSVWQAAVACPSTTPYCNGTGVCGACADGTTQCASGGVQTCASGAWMPSVPCSNSSCSMGQCTGTCSATTKQCSGNSVQTCDATGHWGPAVACMNQACVGGACQGVCAPGATMCTTGGIETCDMTGGWGTAVPCGANQTCTGGGTVAASCLCKTLTGCTTSGPFCEGTTTLAQCAQDGQGCWYASTTSPCTNGACFGSGSTTTCCTNACTAGATQCGGLGLQKCAAQANGCTAWDLGTACGANAACTVTGTTASCSCNAGFASCSSGCVDTSKDIANCGTCGKACPTLAAPSYADCEAGACIGYIGGYQLANGSPSAPADADTMSVYAVQVTTPAVSCQYLGLGGWFGSTDPSGSTQVILALYSDSGGSPSSALLFTTSPDTALQYNDPSGLKQFESGSFNTPSGSGGFAGLSTSTTYWLYMKVGQSAGVTAGVTTGLPCVRGQWINIAPPGSFPTTTTAGCPSGGFAEYLKCAF
jgi:hypothetical protein